MGKIDRRAFLRRAAAIGVSAATIGHFLEAIPARAQDYSVQPGTPREDGTPAPDDQQVLRMVTPSPFRMDPMTYGGDLWQVQMMVFQALTRVDIDNTIVGGVADSWTMSEDGTSYTFALNPNAKFSDGTPLTAADVKWTWDWLANPKSLSVSADVSAGVVKGFQDVFSGATEELEGIVVVDDHTITFNLTAPTPAFPALAGYYNTVTLKKDNVISGGEEWWTAPITSGFFKVTEFTPGDQATMTLERNEFWWREPAKLSKFTMALVADPQTQLVMYDNNEIDGMVCQPAEFAQAIKPGGERSSDLYWDTAVATWYFGYLCSKAPFEDAKVRQGIAHAIDLNAVSLAALNGIYPAQKRVLPAGFPGGGDEQWQPAFDPELAKQRISESTYGSVDALPPITIVVSEQGGATALGTWGKAATVIQQMLDQNLGLKVELVRQLFDSAAARDEFLNALPGGAVFRLSLGASFQDPQFVSNFARTGKSGNVEKYSNPEVDALIDQADSEPDSEKRLGLYTQIDKIISEDAYFMAPFRGTTTWFFKPQVRGLHVAVGRVWNSLHTIYIAAE
jgi:ABC-type transport system substrate-binding protein